MQEENKYNQITILKFSFHIQIGNSTYFPRLALKKESKYNITVIAVTLERHYEELQDSNTKSDAFATLEANKFCQITPRKFPTINIFIPIL